MRNYLSIKALICLVFLSFSVMTAMSQDRIAAIEASLKRLSKDQPGLNEKVELSVNSVSIQEFIRGLAVAHSLNVSIDPGIKVNIINNFANATVSDVLVFLCRQYDLDITFIGSIMSFISYEKPVVEPVAVQPKKLKIEYKNQTDFLSFDLKKDSLYDVAKEITKQSFKNVVLAPGLENKLVSAYIQNRPFQNSLEKLAFANDLVVTATDDNFFLIEKKEEQKGDQKTAASRRGAKGGTTRSGSQGQSLEIKVENDEFVTINAFNVPIVEIIQGVSAELFKNHFLFSEPQGNTSLYIENATYEDFLTYLLNGSDYTFKKEDRVYLIGERKLERLRTTEIVQLQNRTIESVIDIIPADLKKDVEIKEYIEVNSLIMSGSHPKISEIKKFLRQIDKVAPVVMIEVMVVDVKTTRTISTGIDAGVGTAPRETGGTVSPGVDFTLSTSAINDLINSFNGFGYFNIGKVTPNFYLTIKAMEDEGILKKRSTPTLATINGHEASMSIGSTEYYLETSNNVIGTQNPQNIVTQVYKPVNADLSLNIKPIVSGDDQVTLDITVEQSDFTERISQTAPPGNVSRSFKSLIRVKDQEMIMLGGLEQKITTDTGKGLPLLARIPVIKWLFSSRTRSDTKGKLNIFIKPTIIY